MRNYGRMAALVPPHLFGDSRSKAAGAIRTEFADTTLDGFALGAAVFEAPAVCEIDVELRVNGEAQARRGRMRWIRETDDGSPAMPNEGGEWNLYLWGPEAIFSRGRDR
jgi:hypothetical protein